MLCGFVTSCTKGDTSGPTQSVSDESNAPHNDEESTHQEDTYDVTSEEATEPDTTEDTSGDSFDGTDDEPLQHSMFTSYYHLGYATMNVSNIMQEFIGMPYGCEVVSLAMTLAYLGHKIDPRDLFNGYMPHAPYGEANPFYQYIGDATNKTGYGCYAPCVVETANKFLESEGSSLRAHDISGSSIYEILGYIWNGVPVIIWGTLDMQHSDVIASWYFDGELVKWHTLSHCVVITGVLENDFIICDPMVGRVRYSIEEVAAAYAQIYSQAVAIY